MNCKEGNLHEWYKHEVRSEVIVVIWCVEETYGVIKYSCLCKGIIIIRSEKRKNICI